MDKALFSICFAPRLHTSPRKAVDDVIHRKAKDCFDSLCQLNPLALTEKLSYAPIQHIKTKAPGNSFGICDAQAHLLINSSSNLTVELLQLLQSCAGRCSLDILQSHS